DPGFWSNKTIAALEQHGARYSIGVGQHERVRRAVELLPEQSWQALDDSPPEAAPRAPRARSAPAGRSSAAPASSPREPSRSPTGAPTPSSATASSRSRSSSATIAATRRSSSRPRPERRLRPQPRPLRVFLRQRRLAADQLARTQPRPLDRPA